MPRTIAIGLTHPGTVRNHDANAFYLIDTVITGEPVSDYISDPVSRGLHSELPLQFFALAAGIGGNGVGDQAACMVLENLCTVVQKTKPGYETDIAVFVNEFFQSANQALINKFGENPEIYAGTSLALLCLDGYNAWIYACGDCHCYRLHDDKLSRLTADAEYETTTPHRLTSYLGKLHSPLEPKRLVLENGDLFLLTTAGLTGQINEETLEKQLSAPETLTVKPQRLLRLALQQRTYENLAFVLVRVSDLAEDDEIKSTELERKPNFIRHR